MKKCFIVATALMIFGFSTCAQSNEVNIKESDMKIRIIIGDMQFSTTLYDNETAKNLFSMLPLTMKMTELNGNEKYYNFSQNISKNTAQNPVTINAGDIMLYSTNCIVLFYKTFTTNYSYIKIGYINNIKGLETALGKGDIEITFTK